jgi:methionine synthase I (cobalamin-dependent)
VDRDSGKLAKLAEHVTVVDGGWSTMLHARGVPADQPAELGNLTHPEQVVQLGRDYIAAGARVLTTNTFGATPILFQHRGVSADWREITLAGARLARKAVGGKRVLVAGSIGPSGRMLAIRESAEADLAVTFVERVRLLAEGGADLLLLETFSELRELLLALRSISEAVRLPVIASLSFDSGPQRTRTLLGDEASTCAEALDQAGADVIGCNCGGGAAHALPAVVALRAHTRRPLWVKPSAGLPDLEDGRAVYRHTPEEFAGHCHKLIEAGANFVGGCCGVGPQHIRRLAALAASDDRKRPRAGAS